MSFAGPICYVDLESILRMYLYNLFKLFLFFLFFCIFNSCKRGRALQCIKTSETSTGTQFLVVHNDTSQSQRGLLQLIASAWCRTYS